MILIAVLVLCYNFKILKVDFLLSWYSASEQSSLLTQILSLFSSPRALINSLVGSIPLLTSQFLVTLALFKESILVKALLET